jgi:hypothetical protein
MIGGAMQETIARISSLSHQHLSQHQKEDAGLRFVQRPLKNFVPKRASPALHGPIGKSTFSNTPGFIPHNYRNVIGYSQQHLRHLNAGTSSLVEVSLTINTSFIRCSARNPDGHRGQTRNYRTS